MNKEDVVWLTNIEQKLLEDKGWQLIFVSDHFNNHFRYEIKDPDDYYIDFTTTNIYEAIDKINQKIEEGKDERRGFLSKLLS